MGLKIYLSLLKAVWWFRRLARNSGKPNKKVSISLKKKNEERTKIDQIKTSRTL
jgi:hypothetical protein